MALIAGSIREFGFTNPVLVYGENGIIAGHGRVMAVGTHLRNERYAGVYRGRGWRRCNDWWLTSGCPQHGRGQVGWG